MARTRDIKPSFFTNDDLAECSSLARLLFIGLWTIADREGRLQDRPKKIKAEILPYDDCDCDSMLSELERYGFIARYENNGERFLQIINFGKHQKVHPKENPSVIPAVSRCGNAEPNPEQVSDKDVIDNNQGDDQSPSYSLPSFPSFPSSKDTAVVTREKNSVSHETKPERHADTVDVGKTIAAITGWDADPNWFGDYSRIEVWLKAGWDPVLDIVPTVRRLMHGKTAPPRSLRYFEGAIADAYATRTSPIPNGSPKGTANVKNAAPTKTDRAKAAILRAHAALGIGPAGPEDVEQSGIAVFSIAETLRQGTGNAGGDSGDVPVCPIRLLDRPDHKSDGVLPQNERGNAGAG